MSTRVDEAKEKQLYPGSLLDSGTPFWIECIARTPRRAAASLDTVLRIIPQKTV